MLLIDANGYGEIVAEASEDIVSGSFIKVTQGFGQAFACKTVTGDSTDDCLALAYVDPTEQSRRTYSNDSLTSAESWTIKKGQNVVCMRGNGMLIQTDQFADGNYLFDASITYDLANACWKLAGAEDTVYGKMLTSGIVKSKNRVLRAKVKVGAI